MSIEFELDATPQRSYVVNGLRLVSGFAREREVQQQAATVPLDSEEAWVYGPADGKVVQALLMQRPNLKRLNVVVMNRELYDLMGTHEPRPWVYDKRVFLQDAVAVTELGTPFSLSPAELRLCDPEAYRLRDLIQMNINGGFNDWIMSVRRPIEIKQYEINRSVIDTDPHISSFYGSRMGDAIVVAGGPTLARYYDWIKERAAHAVVAAASTVLKPLQDAGIDPDWTVIADPAAKMLRHFDGTQSTGRLVYIPTVHPEVLRAWNGYRAMANICDDPSSDLFCGGSVVHAEIDLAVKIGCTRVYLVGADFCYAYGRSHVEGTANPYATEGAWKPWTTNGNGERVQSEDALLQYRTRLEAYITEHPEVEFVKLGRDGLEVKGVRWHDDT